jgi:hypothetical protein
MDSLQVRRISDYFKEIRAYKLKSKSPLDYYNECGKEKYYRMYGFLLALSDLDIVTRQQFTDITAIAWNLALHGIATKKKLA